MADQAQETVAPALDENAESESVVIDTLDTIESTSQPSSEAHEETKTTSPEETTQPKVEAKEEVKEEVKPEVHVESEADKRFRIKMSQLEKENNEYGRRFKNIEAALTKRPDVYKDMLIETAGLSEKEAEEAVKQFRQQVKSETQGSQPSQASLAPDIGELVRQRYELEKIREAEKAEAKTFLSGHPEINPDNLKEDEKPQVAKLAEGLDIRATNLIESAQLDGKTMTRNEAREIAYSEFKSIFSKEVTKAREQGEIEGMAKSNAISSAVTRTGNISGQVAKASVELTDIERKYAKAANLTDEQYLEWKDKEAVIS